MYPVYLKVHWSSVFKLYVFIKTKSISASTSHFKKIFNKCFICDDCSTGDFDGALAVLTEMEYLVRDRGIIGSNNLPIGSFSDILASCEISRVLLLMLLQVITYPCTCMII